VDATGSGSQPSARHGQNDCATVIGRRNWLFADTPKGAKASANLYSLVETAKANGIEPWRYLDAVFEKLPAAKSEDDVEALLPWNVELDESTTRAAKP
jgi:transposase